MKPFLTTLIIGLLIALPMAIAAETAQDQAISDISHVCSAITVQAQAGDELNFCGFSITADQVTKDAVTINSQEILLGESHKWIDGALEGLKISYDEFADGKATLTLDTEIGKKFSSGFEKDKFKVYYDAAGTPTLAGSVDANEGSIATISYGDNTAYLMIRSSTLSTLTIGMDLENADKAKQEKLHIPWKVLHTTIGQLDEQKMLQTASSDLYSMDVNNGEIQITLGESHLAIKLEKIPSIDINAIKIGSDKPFTATVNGAQRQTETIWITTRLAQMKGNDAACAYDVAGGSLDDFTRMSSVQGYYPSAPAKFFDTFTGYCKDETTLVHYGCVGLTAKKWASTSRVSFLEVICPSCSEGRCAQGPYCMDSDKYAQDPTRVKGKATVFTENPKNSITSAAIATPGDQTSNPKSDAANPLGGAGTAGGTGGTDSTSADASRGAGVTTAPEDYDNGISRLKTQAYEDTCKDATTLTEYSCGPNGLVTTEVTCDCENGACKSKPTPPAGGCLSDGDCVKEQCCHATTCIPKSQKPSCEGVSCTADCKLGTMDCGQGSCVCKNQKCTSTLQKAEETIPCTPKTASTACPADKPICSAETRTCVASTAPSEDLTQARNELQNLETQVTMLKNMFEKQEAASTQAAPKQGIIARVLNLFGIGRAAQTPTNPITCPTAAALAQMRAACESNGQTYTPKMVAGCEIGECVVQNSPA